MIFFKKDTRPIVVVSKQRSGTTAFEQALGEARGIAACGEIFHNIVSRGLFTHRETNFFKWRNALAPEKLREYYFKDSDTAFDDSQKQMARAFLEHVLEQADARFGLLDIKYDSWHHIQKSWQSFGDTPLFMDVLGEYDPYYIHIVRQNQVRRALSVSVASQTNRWHYGKDEQPDSVAAASIQVDPDVIFEKVERTAHEIDVFRHLLEGRRTLELFYETMFDNQRLSASTVEQGE